MSYRRFITATLLLCGSIATHNMFYAGSAVAENNGRDFVLDNLAKVQKAVSQADTFTVSGGWNFFSSDCLVRFGNDGNYGLYIDQKNGNSSGPKITFSYWGKTGLNESDQVVFSADGKEFQAACLTPERYSCEIELMGDKSDFLNDLSNGKTLMISGKSKRVDFEGKSSAKIDLNGFNGYYQQMVAACGGGAKQTTQQQPLAQQAGCSNDTAAFVLNGKSYKGIDNLKNAFTITETYRSEAEEIPCTIKLDGFVDDEIGSDYLGVDNTGKYLVIVDGTSPDMRDLRIVDIAGNKVAFSAAVEAGTVMVRGGTVTFRMIGKNLPFDGSYPPDCAKAKKNGMGCAPIKEVVWGDGEILDSSDEGFIETQ
ncbi:MAG: hypothetical protein HQK84_11555 [Nitrospinae bacterium]|nr:hypothetical protein [Nitrospinota bacterium]